MTWEADEFDGNDSNAKNRQGLRLHQDGERKGVFLPPECNLWGGDRQSSRGRQRRIRRRRRPEGSSSRERPSYIYLNGGWQFLPMVTVRKPVIAFVAGAAR